MVAVGVEMMESAPKRRSPLLLVGFSANTDDDWDEDLDDDDLDDLDLDDYEDDVSDDDDYQDDDDDDDADDFDDYVEEDE